MRENIPNKLIFSSGDPKRRKRSYLLVAVLMVLQLGMIWPVYPLFASPRPLILGFPLSLVWIAAVLILCAICVLIYYLKDHKEEDPWKAG